MNSEEQFNEWNEEKKSIEKKRVREVYIKQRQIWNVKMGKNIGFEENGKGQFMRPVVVIKKVGGLYFTVALTSVNHSSYFHFTLNENTYIDPYYETKHSKAILSQAKVMDVKMFEKNQKRLRRALL